MSETPSQLDRIEDKLDKLGPLVYRHTSDIQWLKSIVFGFFAAISTLYYKIFGS
jgi:hypothetical protein